MKRAKQSELAAQIEKVLEMLSVCLLTENQPFLRTMEKKYRCLLSALEQGDDLRRHSIRGSSRAFLDASSNWDNPFLEELHQAEQLYIEYTKE